MKAHVANDRGTSSRQLTRAEERNRTVLFAFGDGFFLTVVGMVATIAMYGAHLLGWNLAVTCVVGMVAAMVTQMMLALSVAPLLGSIESMIPSMVVGMVSPMLICALHVFGDEPGVAISLIVGAISGVAMIVFVGIYGAFTKRSLRQTYRTG